MIQNSENMRESVQDMIDSVAAGKDPQETLGERGAGRPQKQTVAMKQRRRRPNPKLSRMAKQRYMRNRSKYKTALKKFHKSAAGKMFHKKLGRLKSRLHSGAADMNNDILDSMQYDMEVYAESCLHPEPIFMDLISVFENLDCRDEPTDFEDIFKGIVGVFDNDVEDLVQQVLSGVNPRQLLSED